MFLSTHNFRLSCLLGVLITLIGVDTAFAGWMGFRNDTKDTIVLQETMVVNGVPRPCRPQRLFMGEGIRDTPPVGGSRKISIFDLSNPNRPIFIGDFAAPDAHENILYCLKPDGKGGIVVEAIRTPAQPTSPKK